MESSKEQHLFETESIVTL